MVFHVIGREYLQLHAGNGNATSKKEKLILKMQVSLKIGLFLGVFAQ
jgi:hypothetical protein